MKQQVQNAQAGTLRFRPIRSGQQIVPSAAAVTLKKSDAATDLPGQAVVDTAVTPDASGALSYALTSAQTADLGENYVADWKVTYGGVISFHRDLWDVVRTVLYPVLDEPTLKRYMGLHASFLYRTGSENYTDIIAIAFEELERTLEARGRRPWLVIEAAQLVDAHAYKVMEHICDGLAQNKEGAWWARKEEYAERFKQAMQDLPVRYDADGSGTIKESEDRSTWGMGTIRRA